MTDPPKPDADRPLTVDERLALDKFEPDEEPFIVVATDVCRTCDTKPCLYVCPSQVYRLRKGEPVAAAVPPPGEVPVSGAPEGAPGPVLCAAFGPAPHEGEGGDRGGGNCFCRRADRGGVLGGGGFPSGGEPAGPAGNDHGREL